MRKILFHYSGPYAGTDRDEGFIFPADVSDADIEANWSDWAWQEHEQWSENMEDDGLEPEGPDGSWRDYDEERDAGKITYSNDPVFTDCR